MTRERREVLYSILIIIAIPLLFAANSLYITSRIRDNTNRSARDQANVTNNMIAEGLRADIETGQYEEATAILKSMQIADPTIGSIYVVQRTGDEFQIFAKTEDAVGELTQNDRLQIAIIFDRARSAAKRIDAKNADGRDIRGWNVITPLLAEDGKTVKAAVSTNILTSDTEEVIDRTLLTSFELTAACAVIIIILLFHHLRFVGYADLLRRQREVNQTMTDFLSVATHELKAPTSIIKGTIANIMDKSYGEYPDSITQPLQTAITQTDRMNNLVQDLLNISRIEQGRITYDMKVVDITEIINSVVQNYRPKAAEKQLTISYTGEQAVPVFADAGRVQEIITNLVDNAIKYTEQGSVAITHRQQGTKLLTLVQDTGPGMTEQEKARLFQRFYRVKNEHTKDIQGTGLGLWIIKQYAEKMGGTITVNSIVGVGTEFCVELETAKDTSSSQPTKNTSS